MRAYAQIVPTFWTRGSGKRLRGKPDAQVLALYLMTAPASNLIGLFYLPLTTLCHETGLTAEQVNDALALPELAEIVRYDADAELVWIPEAARYQIGETMGERDKRRPAVLRELAMAGSHAFVRAFRARYSEPFGLDVGQLAEGVSEAPSEGHPPESKPPDPDPDPVRISGSGSPEGDTGEGERLPPTDAPAVVTETVQARARRCVAEPHAGAYEAPEEWGEVVAVVEAFKRATGQPGARVGTFARDRGVQAIVGLLADGYTVPELESAVERAVAGDWWSGGKRGLSSLSPEVVRRALAADPVAAPRYESADERTRVRNHLLGKAREGEFGVPAKFWERCGDPAALADRLERNQPVTPDDLPADLATRFARYLEKRREQTANA